MSEAHSRTAALSCHVPRSRIDDPYLHSSNEPLPHHHLATKLLLPQAEILQVRACGYSNTPSAMFGPLTANEGGVLLVSVPRDADNQLTTPQHTVTVTRHHSLVETSIIEL